MGLKPTRQWVIRTDERGFTRLSEKYKVPNVPQDEFYKLNGVVTLPIRNNYNSRNKGSKRICNQSRDFCSPNQIK